MKFGENDTSYRAAGGEAGIRQLVARFYDLMDELPDARAIRAMHPADLAESREKLALFLCGWLGGPRKYQEKYGTISIPGIHQHLHINATHRDAWLNCMALAAEEQEYAPEFKTYLLEQLAVPAERVRIVSEKIHGSPG